MAASHKRQRTDSVPYLVRFPDQTSAVQMIQIGRVAEEGTVIFGGWIVDEIKIIDEIVDGDPVSYAVWVRKAPSAQQCERAHDSGDAPRLRSSTPGDQRDKQPKESEMPLYVTAQTKQKIDNLPDRLSDEFADVAPNEVREEVEEVTETLLNDAQFEDFVPLLAYRYTREHLIGDGHDPSRDEE